MAKPTPKPDPELNRAFLRAAIAEGVFFMGGVAAYLLTKQFIWLIAGFAAGAVVFAIISIPALKAAKRRREEQAGQSSIVEGGGF